MVNIHQQVDTALALYHLEAVERCLLQVERPDEVLLIGSELVVCHFTDGNLYGYTVLGGLHNLVALSGKVDTQFRMCLHDLLDSLCQLPGIYICRIAEQVRNVIDGRSRILKTFKVDACLGIAQRNGGER